ncbi:MAG: GNAT family N-acetyltransferase [Patescibacteria group bacterium]
MPTTSEVIISPFDGDQATADTIAALHLDLRFWQREHGQNQFRTNIRESQADLTNIGSYYVEPGGNFFIARDASDNVITGFVGLKRAQETEEMEAVLKRLAVLPKYHRRGIGTLLVGALVEWAAESGFRKISLSTGEGENARSLYEKFGFVVVGFDEEHQDHLMELELVI